MKTTIIISAIILCLLDASITHAQVSGGFEAAVTTSSVKITDIKNDFTDVINGNGIIGYEGGIFIIAGLGRFYLEPKLLFDYQSGTLSYDVNESEQNVSFHTGKIVVPVLIGFKLISPVLNLEAGPVYNHLLYATRDFNGNELSLAQSGLGYRMGVNIAVSTIHFTVSWKFRTMSPHLIA